MLRIRRRFAILGIVALLWLVGASPSLAASVPAGARDALAPVTKMIATLVAIAIGLGVTICGAVIVWGGIEKTLAGANQDAEHRAARRIQNGIHGLVWMILASRDRVDDHGDRGRLRAHRHALLRLQDHADDRGPGSPCPPDPGTGVRSRRGGCRVPPWCCWPWRSSDSASR